MYHNVNDAATWSNYSSNNSSADSKGASAGPDNDPNSVNSHLGAVFTNIFVGTDFNW